MKVTLPNIGRFWKRLMFPPDTDQYRYNRLTLRSDMPWEPWLHCGVWIATFIVIIVGEKGVSPPVDGIDWYWIFFGLVSPFVGFFSVWTLEHHTGRARYYALWGRMISDAGLVIAIMLYQIDRFVVHDEIEFLGLGYGVMPNLILFLAMWFTATLVVRDIRFIIVTEKLATEIYRSARKLSVSEWVSRWGDDDSR